MNVIWGKPTHYLDSKPSLSDFYNFLKPLIEDEEKKKDWSEIRRNIYSSIETPIRGNLTDEQ